jgi:hypothetical protein
VFGLFALCTVLFRHILPALQNLRFRLFGLAKRLLPRTLDEMHIDNIQKMNKFIEEGEINGSKI